MSAPVRNAPGFTLVEILVVLGVFAFAMVFASTVFVQNQQVQVTARDYDRLVSDVRFGMGYLAQEIRNSTVDYAWYQDPQDNKNLDAQVLLDQPQPILRLRNNQGVREVIGLNTATGQVVACTRDPVLDNDAKKCDDTTTFPADQYSPITSTSTKITRLSFTVVPASNPFRPAPSEATDCRTTSAFQGSTGICSCAVAATDCLPDQICSGGACRLDPSVDSLQPRVTILLSGQTARGLELRNPVETTVTTRLYLR